MKVQKTFTKDYTSKAKNGDPWSLPLEAIRKELKNNKDRFFAFFKLLCMAPNGKAAGVIIEMIESGESSERNMRIMEEEFGIER